MWAASEVKTWSLSGVKFTHNYSAFGINILCDFLSLRGGSFVDGLLTRTGLRADVSLFPRRHHYLDTNTLCKGSIFHFNSPIKQRWSVTTAAQPSCIFNALPARTASPGHKNYTLKRCEGEAGWRRRSPLSVLAFAQIPAFDTARKKGIRWNKAGNKHPAASTSNTVAVAG